MCLYRTLSVQIQFIDDGNTVQLLDAVQDPTGGKIGKRNCSFC